MAYENNHFIPQFILREYGDRINVFNVKDQSLKTSRKTNSIFAGSRIYPPDLEQNIGYKVEAPFAKLFHEKLMKGVPGGNVLLTRKEVLLMKRFFLLETMRVESERDIIFFDKLTSQLSLNCEFTEKEMQDETPEARWHRNLQVIIETENLWDISRHELCTYEALKWANIFLSGYFAFWDSSCSDTDFLINDIGMTSEVEDSYLKDGFEHEKKDYLQYLIQRESNSPLKNAYLNILQNQFFFHENFYLFPLSKKRMIVLVNPFFRLYDKKEKMFCPSIWPTHIEDKKLFEKNLAQRVPVLLGKPVFKDDDIFTYTVKSISDADAEYINMLMLDRVDTFLGYATLDGINKSVQRYIDFHKEKGITAPVDYSALLK